MNTIKILNDDWVDRKYVLENYPLGSKTYNNKVTQLDKEEYKEYSMIGKFGKRFIHKSILDNIFLSDRIPNRDQPHQVRKWVKKHKWDYFGNITPLDSDIDTNEKLIKKLFNLLKYRYPYLILFYSIEKNPHSNTLCHTHYLLKTKEHINTKEIISLIKQDTLLNEFLYPSVDIKTNSRIQLEPYDDSFYDGGIKYVLKNNISIGLLR